MHDVLDLRALVPDEAEQLAHSGYPADALAAEARLAAGADEPARLARIEDHLSRLDRDPAWAFEEPDDDATLLALADAALVTPVDAARLPDRIRGAWLGRTVGNTLGKPVEGLGRGELEIYLRAADHWPQIHDRPALG